MKDFFLFHHTHRLSQHQCVVHEVDHVCGSGGNIKEMSCSQACVHRVIEHPGEDAIEAHHTC